MEHKSGFVNILGNPNVGKSTIMNNLIGEKLAIITSKAQTTRHRIMGIVNGDDFQMIYSDTPGIIDPAYKLHEYMMKYVRRALEDADIILFVTDVYANMEKNQSYIELLKNKELPVLLLMNKIDLSDQQTVQQKLEQWQNMLPNAIPIPVSAKEHFNLDKVFSTILEHLPPHPPYFPKDQLTDRPARFFVSEIIREKILMNYQQEIPYATEVQVESFKESPEITHIRAVIYVLKRSQKGIIIGKHGEALKQTGTAARKEIEAFLEQKVHLDLHVKVNEDWKYEDRPLKRFGYNN